MVKGLYISGTNMIANINKMDVLGVNLANVDTTGYKKDRVEVESFNARLYSRINGTNIPFETGPNTITQSQNGEAITATTEKGYFKVDTPNGIHYDKSMIFFKDTDGYLRTIYKNIGGTVDPLKGNLILGQKGPIFVGDADFEMDANGNINVGGTKVDQLVTQTGPNTVGTISAGIRNYTVLTDFEQGQLDRTESKFDLAIKGDGFFSIRTETGDHYSRDGSFTINALGELVTFDNDKVLGLNGPIIIESDEFTVNEFGEIIQNGEITDKLQLTTFTNVSDIYKIGAGYYKEKTELTGEKVPFEGEILQGFLETSNVDSISEMIQLIEMNRNYQNSQKVITTIDEMLGKAVTELGRV